MVYPNKLHKKRSGPSSENWKDSIKKYQKGQQKIYIINPNIHFQSYLLFSF